MGKISVLIVDDNVRTINMLEEIVQNDEEMMVVGKAENGLDALEQIREKASRPMLTETFMRRVPAYQ